MTPRQEREIDLDLIDVGTRLRDVVSDEVEKLAASMKERGQITPIELREGADGRYRLTVGAHRYAAAQLLAWPSITAIILNCSDEEARLREIDENLYRHELSPYDTANFLEERRLLWEKVYGHIKRGGDRRSKVQIAPLIDEVQRGASFVKETSAKFGLPRDLIKRSLARKAKISPDLWVQLRSTDAATNGSMLDKIRKLSLEEQVLVAAEMRAGRKIAESIRIITAQEAPDSALKQFEALKGAWERAGDEARANFLKFIGKKK